MLIKIKGILDFYLKDVSKKHISQSSWKKTAIIKTNCDLDKYYAWFLKKRFNLELNLNLRGSHITIINDIVDNDIYQQASKIFNGREIDFYIEIEPRSSGLHWWLRSYSTDAESIRESIGLDRIPYHPFHLTIGHANTKYLDHSEYILRQCVKFDLISSNKRIDFKDHEIIEF